MLDQGNQACSDFLPPLLEERGLQSALNETSRLETEKSEQISLHAE